MSFIALTISAALAKDTKPNLRSHLFEKRFSALVEKEIDKKKGNIPFDALRLTARLADEQLHENFTCWSKLGLAHVEAVCYFKCLPFTFACSLIFYDACHLKSVKFLKRGCQNLIGGVTGQVSHKYTMVVLGPLLESWIGPNLSRCSSNHFLPLFGKRILCLGDENEEMD